MEFKPSPTFCVFVDAAAVLFWGAAGGTAPVSPLRDAVAAAAVAAVAVASRIPAGLVMPPRSAVTSCIISL